MTRKTVRICVRAMASLEEPAVGMEQKFTTTRSGGMSMHFT